MRKWYTEINQGTFKISQVLYYLSENDVQTQKKKK